MQRGKALTIFDKCLRIIKHFDLGSYERPLTAILQVRRALKYHAMENKMQNYSGTLNASPDSFVTSCALKELRRALKNLARVGVHLFLVLNRKVMPDRGNFPILWEFLAKIEHYGKKGIFFQA